LCDRKCQVALSQKLPQNLGINAYKLSGTSTREQRPGLAALLDCARPGDAIVVVGIDRLGRNAAEVMATIRELRDRDIVLRSLREGSDTSNTTVAEAEAAIERLAVAPADEGLVMRDIWLLRLGTLLARAHDDTEAYAHSRDRYRDMARSLGFEGHIAWAKAMR
jgi:Resolvase, N terminal domain